MNNEKWKTKNKKRKLKKGKQTNYTLLSKMSLANWAKYRLCTPQKWYVLESIVSKMRIFSSECIKNA